MHILPNRTIFHIIDTNKVPQSDCFAQQIRDERQPEVKEAVRAYQPFQRIEGVFDTSEQISGKAADKVSEIEGDVN